MSQGGRSPSMTIAVNSLSMSNLDRTKYLHGLLCQAAR